MQIVREQIEITGEIFLFEFQFNFEFFFYLFPFDLQFIVVVVFSHGTTQPNVKRHFWGQTSTESAESLE